MKVRQHAVWFAAAIAAASSPLPAQAQQYPNGPVRIVVGFAASSSADMVARLVGKHLEQHLGQPVVVENRPGNSSMTAAEAVARAPHDGHTLFMATVANTIQPARTIGAKFNLAADMAPVALLGVVPNLLVAHPSVPAKDIKELVTLMRAKPDDLTYGTSGVGTASHLAAELLNLRIGAKVLVAHYQGGSSQRVVDLIAGRISVAFNTAASLVPQVQAGQLKAMAVAQMKRTGILPDVPTLEEVGIPGMDAGVWIGLLAPKDTPPAIVERLAAGANEALKNPGIIKLLQTQGIDTVGSSPAEFANYIRDDTERWIAVLTAAGLRK